MSDDIFSQAKPVDADPGGKPFSADEHERRVEEFATKLLRAMHAALHRHAVALSRLSALGGTATPMATQQQQQQQSGGGDAVGDGMIPEPSLLLAPRVAHLAQPHNSIAPSKTRQRILEERQQLAQRALEGETAAAVAAAAPTMMIFPPIFPHSSRVVVGERRGEGAGLPGAAVMLLQQQQQQHGADVVVEGDDEQMDSVSQRGDNDRGAGLAPSPKQPPFFVPSSSRPAAAGVAPLNVLNLSGGALRSPQVGQHLEESRRRALFDLPSKKQLRELKVLAFALRETTTKLSAKVNRDKQHALQRTNAVAARSLMREHHLVDDMLLVSSARNVLSHLEGTISSFRQKRRRARLVVSAANQDDLLGQLGALVNQRAAQREERERERQEQQAAAEALAAKARSLAAPPPLQPAAAAALGANASLPEAPAVGNPLDSMPSAARTEPQVSGTAPTFTGLDDEASPLDGNNSNANASGSIDFDPAATADGAVENAAQRRKRRSTNANRRARFAESIVAEEHLPHPEHPHLPAKMMEASLVDYLLEHIHNPGAQSPKSALAKPQQQQQEFDADEAPEAAHAAEKAETSENPPQPQPPQDAEDPFPVSPRRNRFLEPAPDLAQFAPSTAADVGVDPDEAAASSAAVADLVARARMTLSQNEELVRGGSERKAEVTAPKQQPVSPVVAPVAPVTTVQSVETTAAAADDATKRKRNAAQQQQQQKRRESAGFMAAMGGSSIGLREPNVNNNGGKAKDFARPSNSFRRETSGTVGLLTEADRERIRASQAQVLARVPSAVMRYAASDRDSDLATISKNAKSLTTAVANAKTEMDDLTAQANAGQLSSGDVQLVGMLIRESEDLLASMKPVSALLSEEQRMRRQFVARVRGAATAELNDLGAALLHKQKEAVRLREQRRELIKQYLIWRQTQRADAAIAADTFEAHVAANTQGTNDVGTQCSVPKAAIPLQLVKTVRLMQEMPNLQRHVAEVRKLVVELSSVDIKSQDALRCQACANATAPQRSSPLSPSSPGIVLHDAMLVWPCGDTICSKCARATLLEYKDQPFKKCPACRMISLSEAFAITPNLLVQDVAAKYAFKQSGFCDVAAASDALQQRLAAFKKEEVIRVFDAVQAAVAASEQEDAVAWEDQE